jgi:death on curing protein
VEGQWAPGLDDFVEAAAVILDVDESAIRRLPGLALAESAIAAPFAGMDEQDAYPSLTDKAAILIERIARNHPLPDGNKRVALAMAIVFLERNGHRWGLPDHDRDVAMVERIAAGDATSTDDIRTWIDERVSK